MDNDERWSAWVWTLPAAVIIFFWPTVLITLYVQVVADFLSGRSIGSLVFSLIWGIPLTLFVISLVMWIPFLIGGLVVSFAGKWRLTRALVAVGSLVGGLGLAALCVLSLVSLFS